MQPTPRSGPRYSVTKMLGPESCDSIDCDLFIYFIDFYLNKKRCNQADSGHICWKGRLTLASTHEKERHPHVIPARLINSIFFCWLRKEYCGGRIEKESRIDCWISNTNKRKIGKTAFDVVQILDQHRDDCHHRTRRNKWAR